MRLSPLRTVLELAIVGFERTATPLPISVPLCPGTIEHVAQGWAGVVPTMLGVNALKLPVDVYRQMLGEESQEVDTRTGMQSDESLAASMGVDDIAKWHADADGAIDDILKATTRVVSLDDYRTKQANN